MLDDAPGPGPSFLSAMPASAFERRVAATVVAVTALVFVALVPLATTPLAKVWAFIPVYQSALIVSDLVTAALLVGQFMITRSRALRVLVCGYLFTGLMASVHMLSFPGLFAEGGLIGGTAQTTAWLYMFWHAGFPLSVIAYCCWRGELRAVGTTRALVEGGLWAVAAMALLAWAAVSDLLPDIMVGNRYTPAMIGVVSIVWLLSLAALLLLLWRRRPPSVLDLWLMVVMCAWLCDIALSAVFNGGRFDLGFYAGRLYGLLAASFVLMVLLIENGWLYAQLLGAMGELHRLSAIDPLTSIANRRAFDADLEREWRRAQRHGMPLALLMIDVDYFKKFNDDYGHVAGDECLRCVASTLSQSARRAGDLAARYGGEEFALLLPETDEGEALHVAQHLCSAVDAVQIAHAQSPTGRVSVSVGVACIRPGRDDLRPLALVEQADQALYAAKAEGRNRARLAATPSSWAPDFTPITTAR